ncbi:hypothetical protein BLOT_004956 [Blomia tropicalis]|nr:hypothetical protein BLOT_004956 [Blomia tropicalis]
MDGHVAGQVHQQIDLTSNDDKSLVKEIKWETNRNGMVKQYKVDHSGCEFNNLAQIVLQFILNKKKNLIIKWNLSYSKYRSPIN